MIGEGEWVKNRGYISPARGPVPAQTLTLALSGRTLGFLFARAPQSRLGWECTAEVPHCEERAGVSQGFEFSHEIYFTLEYPKTRKGLFQTNSL